MNDEMGTSLYLVYGYKRLMNGRNVVTHRVVSNEREIANTHRINSAA